jgi:uncharacterized lipoprotein YbaY/heat shock protein HslJ
MDRSSRMQTTTPCLGASRTILPVALAILAVGTTAAMAQTIKGTATYRERMALPPGAVFEAVIEDVSRADAKAETIAQTRVPSPGNPPITFTIVYDPAKILPDRRYAVRATILVDEKLLFTTDTAAPALTGGNPNTVKLVMRRVGAGPTPPPQPAGGKPAEGTAQPPAAASSPLTGTSWQLVKFQGSDDKTLTPDDGSKYTLEFAAGWQLNARIDCNRGRGSWKSSGPNHLQFGPLALTRAMCPSGSMYDQIVKQLPNIRSYVIKDGHLFLSLMADGGIYEFQPVAKTKP